MDYKGKNIEGTEMIGAKVWDMWQRRQAQLQLQQQQETAVASTSQSIAALRREESAFNDLHQIMNVLQQRVDVYHEQAQQLAELDKQLKDKEQKLDSAVQRLTQQQDELNNKERQVDQYKKDAEDQVRQRLAELEDKRRQMQQHEEQVRADEQRLQQLSDKLNKLSLANNSSADNEPSEQVKLNVGGTMFLTTRSTLTSEQDTLFRAMLSPGSNFAGSWKKDTADGCPVYLLDCDPKHFHIVLNHLRGRNVLKQLQALNAAELDALQQDVDYYGIAKLSDMISQVLQERE